MLEALYFNVSHSEVHLFGRHQRLHTAEGSTISVLYRVRQTLDASSTVPSADFSAEE